MVNIGKPEIGNNSSPAGVGQSNPAYDTAGALADPFNAEVGEMQSQPNMMRDEEDNYSKEAMQSIAQRIGSEDANGKPSERAMADQIDDADIVGDEMEGNVSRQENFDNNVPGDMGIGGEHSSESDPMGENSSGEDDSSPDLSSVLRDGLDSHASNIQKEKVVSMVGQALGGFKKSKDVLERAKDQAPELYNASIMMLKAMIEMAKMLGLDNSGSEDSQGPIAAQGEEIIGGQDMGEQDDEWQNPFPAHPDKGGESQKVHHAAAPGDAAQDPKAERQ